MASAIVFSDHSGVEVKQDQSNKEQEGICQKVQSDCSASLPKQSRLDFSVPSNSQPPIETSIDLSTNKKYETVERRYYKRYYKIQNDSEDQVVLLHSNRICLVSIAHKHPIIQNNLKIVNLKILKS